MEVRVKEPKEWLREVEVVVEPQEVKKKISEITDLYSSKVKLPGFREGKAPKVLIEKRYGEALEATATKELIETTYQEIIEKKNIKPLTQAKVTTLNLNEDKELSFTLSFEVVPEFELHEYKAIRVVKPKPQGFDAEFEKRLRELQIRCATYLPLDRPAQYGDFLFVDYGIYEGDKLLSKKHIGVIIQLGDENNDKRINDGLFGVKAGETREVVITYPQDYSDKNLAGKSRIHRFEVRGVKERHLPELNDNFATDLGFKDLEDLRQSINAAILDDWENEIKQGMKNQIYDYLLRVHQFEPPSSLVELAYREILAENNWQDTEELQKKLYDICVSRAKLNIILSRIAEQEGIKIEPSEVEQELANIIKTANNPEAKRRFELLGESAVFQNLLLRKKVTDFLYHECCE